MAEFGAGTIETIMATAVERIAVAMVAAINEYEFPVSQERVPVEYETLKNTGYVSEPVIDGEEATVTLGYGTNEDETGIYAIVQEFRSDFNHPNGGQAYYLTQTVNEGASSFLDRVAHHLGSLA